MFFRSISIVVYVVNAKFRHQFPGKTGIKPEVDGNNNSKPSVKILSRIVSVFVLLFYHYSRETKLNLDEIHNNTNRAFSITIFNIYSKLLCQQQGRETEKSRE